LLLFFVIVTVSLTKTSLLASPSVLHSCSYCNIKNVTVMSKGVPNIKFLNIKMQDIILGSDTH